VDGILLYNGINTARIYKRIKLSDARPQDFLYYPNPYPSIQPQSVSLQTPTPARIDRRVLQQFLKRLVYPDDIGKRGFHSGWLVLSRDKSGVT